MEANPMEVLSHARTLNSLASELENDLTKFQGSRKSIIEAAEKIVIAARGGGENLYRVANATVQECALRCAISLNVFELIVPGAKMAAAEIAEANNADKQLVVRIMRALTSTHIFDELSEETYAHNTFSLAFISQSHRDLYKTIYDTAWKACYALPEYLEKNGWRNIEDYNNCAFQYGYRTNLGMWEWMQEEPERMRVFNSGMQSNANTTMQVEFPYPFIEKLNGEPINEDEVVLVDVGGGRGQALQRLKTAFPQLKGQLILQDQDPVINDAVSQGLPSYITPQAHSFFTPNPINNARAYYFRRIFHDWSDPASLEILKNVVCSMGPKSKLLISDNVMPATGAHWSAALPDLRMMAIIAGMERTRAQWEALLKRAGLGKVRFWQAEGSSFGIVEADLGEPDENGEVDGATPNTNGD